MSIKFNMLKIQTQGWNCVGVLYTKTNRGILWCYSCLTAMGRNSGVPPSLLPTCSLNLDIYLCYGDVWVLSPLSKTAEAEGTVQLYVSITLSHFCYWLWLSSKACSMVRVKDFSRERLFPRMFCVNFALLPSHPTPSYVFLFFSRTFILQM